VAGIAHELIKSKLVDVDFMHKYCVGYDEETLPKGAPKNSSYYAYVMGTGYDKVEKTPAWAASITKIPEARIVQLAHEIGEAKPCYIAQGWGIQRHANGDSAARSVMLLAQLVGQVGKPGTNSGAREGNSALSMPCLPAGDNPIQVKFPNYLWVEAIQDGPSLTSKNAGIMNADKLPTSIKLLINYGNNMPANQNGDINYTAKVLQDESLCEFILCYDVMMTPSAKFADIILPDLTPQETYSMSAAGEYNDTLGIWMGNPIGNPVEERREVYEVCGEIAERLDVGDAYTEGKTREQWRHQLYDEMREEYPQLPTYEQMQEQGIYKEVVEVPDEVDPFIQDPAANPL
jgi:Tat-targeted selenate reductase subunit YnfE